MKLTWLGPDANASLLIVFPAMHPERSTLARSDALSILTAVQSSSAPAVSMLV
jgi:hypothetical protein